MAYFFICGLPYLSRPWKSKANCGEPFQVWEMWLSPHSEKPVGSEVGKQDPRPWISSPVGNQACIVLRLPWDLLLLKNSLTLTWGSKCLLSIFIFIESGLDPPGMGPSLFDHFSFYIAKILLLHCKYPPLMYSVTSSLLSAKITTQNKPMNNKWGPSLM